MRRPSYPDGAFASLEEERCSGQAGLVVALDEVETLQPFGATCAGEA